MFLFLMNSKTVKIFQFSAWRKSQRYGITMEILKHWHHNESIVAAWDIIFCVISAWIPSSSFVYYENCRCCCSCCFCRIWFLFIVPTGASLFHVMLSFCFPFPKAHQNMFFLLFSRFNLKNFYNKFKLGRFTTLLYENSTMHFWFSDLIIATKFSVICASFDYAALHKAVW